MRPRRAARAGPTSSASRRPTGTSGPLPRDARSDAARASSTCSRPTPATGPRHLEPVDRRLAGERRRSAPASTEVELVLADGTDARAATSTDGAVDVRRPTSRRLPPAVARRAGVDESTTIVVAADGDAAVGRARRRRRAVRPGLRAVGARLAAALVRPPRRAAARRCPRSASTSLVDAAAVRRVPRRAVRPQPVRAGEPAALERGVPRRRRRCPRPPCRPIDRRSIDWRGARPAPPAPAARRAARDLDPVRAGRGSTASSPSRPDVADYARFRAPVAVDPADARRPAALVEAQPPASPSTSPTASWRASRARAAPRSPSTCRSAATPPATRRGPTPTCSPPAMAVGAPPDEFFADGQNWGFPPQLPGAGRRSGHALWRTARRPLPASTPRCCASTT